jgi:hypothetical protein
MSGGDQRRVHLPIGHFFPLRFFASGVAMRTGRIPLVKDALECSLTASPAENGDTLPVTYKMMQATGMNENTANVQHAKAMTGRENRCRLHGSPRFTSAFGTQAAVSMPICS